MGSDQIKTDWQAMTDEKFEAEVMKVMVEEARTGAGARAFEEYLSGPYREEWHRIWQEGREAEKSGKSRDDNPHNLKVWRAVWEYGWDGHIPMTQ